MVSFRVGDSFNIKHIMLNKGERTSVYLTMQGKIKLDHLLCSTFESMTKYYIFSINIG